MSDSTPVAPADQEVLITRILEAPRERVFRAWTDPDEVAAWFGPENFDTPRDRIHIDRASAGATSSRWSSAVAAPSSRSATRSSSSSSRS